MLRFIIATLLTVLLVTIVSAFLNHKPEVPDFSEQWMDGTLTSKVTGRTVIHNYEGITP